MRIGVLICRFARHVKLTVRKLDARGFVRLKGRRHPGDHELGTYQFQMVARSGVEPPT